MTAAAEPTTASPSPEREELPRMSFGDHLDELRKRLIKAFGAVLLAVVCLIPFKEEVQGVILGPYRAQWRESYENYVTELKASHAAGEITGELEVEALDFNLKYEDVILSGDFGKEANDRFDLIKTRGGFPMPYELVATGGLQDFWVFLAASLVFAICIASPVVLWQAWAFIAAGLYSHEKKVVYRHVPLALVLLIGGILFGYFLVVPYGLFFLVQLMNPGQVTPMLSVSDYFSFMFSLTAALGAVFQLPMLMLALSKVGVITFKGYVEHWRGIILGMWVIAAIVTPPDPATQALMAGPLVLLFLFGLFLVRQSEKRRGSPSQVPAEKGAGS